MLRHGVKRVAGSLRHGRELRGVAHGFIAESKAVRGEDGDGFKHRPQLEVDGHRAGLHQAATSCAAATAGSLRMAFTVAIEPVVAAVSCGTLNSDSKTISSKRAATKRIQRCSSAEACAASQRRSAA